jgi:hypothetical protein
LEDTAPQEKVYIRIDPHSLRLVAMVIGLGLGVLMVALDPIWRFDDVPTRINWREAALSGIILSLYGMLLGFIVTEFWKTMTLWLVVVITTPILVGVLAFWNELASIFGATRDILLFVPLVGAIHAAMVGMVLLYLNFARQVKARRVLAFTAVPVVLVILTFLVLGRLRWSNQDADRVMLAVNQYASTIMPGDYEIEYQGINYGDGQASVGRARIHGESIVLDCDARIYLDDVEVTCELQEE